MGKGRNLQGLRKDGSLFPLEVGLTPVMHNGMRGVLCTIVDVSTRVAAEQAAVAIAEAGAAAKARGDTLATMSHEIRNPLNGVIGSAALLLDMCTTEEQKELVQTIAACGEATLSIVNDILDWAKVGNACRYPTRHRCRIPRVEAATCGSGMAAHSLANMRQKGCSTVPDPYCIQIA